MDRSSFGDGHGIGGMDAKENPEDFGFLVSGFNFLKSVMVFFISKTAFQSGGSGFAYDGAHEGGLLF